MSRKNTKKVLDNESDIEDEESDDESSLSDNSDEEEEEESDGEEGSVDAKDEDSDNEEEDDEDKEGPEDENIDDNDDCLATFSTILNKEQRKEVPKDQRYHNPILTQYEKVRILAARAEQIKMTGPMLKLDNPDDLKRYSALTLAKMELKQKTSPIKIQRDRPDNTYEVWSINELDIHSDDE